MSRFAYHDLWDQGFERLVVWICHFLLGPGVQQFSSGPDGGRDATFIGTANCFPSLREPARGKFIIQAKHTSDPIAKCSDPDFSGDAQDSILSQEIPRVRRLRDQGELDHYLLFTNRRMSGITHAVIRERLRQEAGVPDPHVCGTEDIDRYLKAHPRAAELAELRELDGPLRCTPDELASVIVHVARTLPNERQPSRTTQSLERTRFDRKNRINGLSPEMATFIQRNYMNQFHGIREFLASGDNDTIRASYVNATEEFAARLIAHRSEAPFDKLLVQLSERLIERDPDLKRHARLTRTLLYYMYFNCDIGTPAEGEAHAETDEA